jgi:hypothetical protein
MKELMKRFLPVVGFGVAVALLIGCGGGGTAGDTSGGGTTGGTTGGQGAVVTGRVLTEGTSVGIPNIVVQFFNSAGVVVGSGTTDASGNFSAAVAVTAVTFMVDANSISDAYYRHVAYGNKTYSPSIPGCRAPAPVLSAGTTTPLPGPIQIPQAIGPPPPPPTGCS